MNLKLLNCRISVMQLELKNSPYSFRGRYISCVKIICNLIDLLWNLISIDVSLQHCGGMITALENIFE